MNNEKTLEILSLLQAYNDMRTETADTALQATLWNLTKARRSSQGFTALPLSCNTGMTASAVRWDLNPRVGIVDPTEHTSNEEKEDLFQMMDLANPTTKEMDPPPSLVAEASPEGLRQRRKAGQKEEETKEWVEESAVAVTESDDPLILLGGSLPPKELRKAHEKALEAVQQYCKAASLVAAIQQRLNDE